MLCNSPADSAMLILCVLLYLAHDSWRKRRWLDSSLSVQQCQLGVAETGHHHLREAGHQADMAGAVEDHTARDVVDTVSE